MLDLRYFRDRRFSVSSGGMTLIFFAMFGTFFLVSQYFQLVLGLLRPRVGPLPAPDGVRDDHALPAGAEARQPLRRGPRGARSASSSVALGLVLFSLLGVDTVIWYVYGPILLSGGRHGPHDDAADDADHVGRAGHQGRRRLGHERHHPRARRRARRGRARLPRHLHLRRARSATPSAACPPPTRRRPSRVSSVRSVSPSAWAPEGSALVRRGATGVRRRHGRGRPHRRRRRRRRGGHQLPAPAARHPGPRGPGG